MQSFIDHRRLIFRTNRHRRDVTIPAPNQLPNHYLYSCDVGRFGNGYSVHSQHRSSFEGARRAIPSKAMTRGVPSQFSCTTNVVLLAFLLVSACVALPTLNITQSSLRPSSNSSELDAIIPHCKLILRLISPLFCPHQKWRDTLKKHQPSISTPHLNPVLQSRPTNTSP